MLVFKNNNTFRGGGQQLPPLSETKSQKSGIRYFLPFFKASYSKIIPKLVPNQKPPNFRPPTLPMPIMIKWIQIRMPLGYLQQAKQAMGKPNFMKSLAVVINCSFVMYFYHCFYFKNYICTIYAYKES